MSISDIISNVSYLRNDITLKMQGLTNGIVSNLSDFLSDAADPQSQFKLNQVELESQTTLTKAQWILLWKHLTSNPKRYEAEPPVLVRYRSFNVKSKKGTEIRDITLIHSPSVDHPTGRTTTQVISKTKVSSMNNTRYSSNLYPIKIALSLEVPASRSDIPATIAPDALRSSRRWNFRTKKWYITLMMINSTSGQPEWSLEIEKLFGREVTSKKALDISGINRYGLSEETINRMAFSKQIVNDLLDVTKYFYSVAIGSNILYTTDDANSIHTHLVTSLAPRRQYDDKTTVIPRYILNKAINLTPKNLTEEFMVKGDYRMTMKADGERKMLIFLDSSVYIAAPPDRINKIASWSKDIKLPIEGCVLDGELLTPDDMLTDNPKRWTYLVIDCLLDDKGNDIRMDPKSVRMAKAREIVGKINSYNIEGLEVVAKQFIPFADTASFYSIFGNLAYADMLSRTGMKGPAYDKEIARLGLDDNSLKALLTKVRSDTASSYKSDGIILEPFNQDYFRRANANKLSIFKWKPAVVLTVDLFYSAATKKVYSSNEHGKNVIEFTGTPRYPFTGVVHFPEGINILPFDIVYEFRLSPGPEDQPKDIEYYRERPDKEIANNTYVAASVWNDMNNPLTIQDVTGKTTKPMRSYQNGIKMQLLDKAYSDGGRVLLDVGSGKGADISKWTRSGYDIVYGMEPDPSNYGEFAQRLAARKKVMTTSDLLKTTIIPINEPVQNRVALKSKMKKGKDGKLRKIDVVALFNSTTYFWKDKKTFDSLIAVLTDPELVDLKKVRILVLSLDGDTVVELIWPRLRQSFRRDQEGYTTDLFTIVVDDWATGQIRMDITGTLVQNQTEWLPVLGNLTNALSKHKIQMQFKRRADKEGFLSEDALLLSSLYSYAYYSPGNIPSRRRGRASMVTPMTAPVDERIKMMLIEASNPFSEINISGMSEEDLGRKAVSVVVPKLISDEKKPVLGNVLIVPKTHPSILASKRRIRDAIPVQERLGHSSAAFDGFIHIIGKHRCRRSVNDEFGDDRFIYRLGTIQTSLSLIHCVLDAADDAYRQNRNYITRRCMAFTMFRELVANGFGSTNVSSMVGSTSISHVSWTLRAPVIKSFTTLINMNIVVIQSMTDDTSRVLYMDKREVLRKDIFTIVVNYTGNGYELVGTKGSDAVDNIRDNRELFESDDDFVKTLRKM